MDLGLAGRVYVLTGASRGLGFATAQCLVADGARVVVSARDQARVDAAVDRLNGNQDGSGSATAGSATGLAADLADPDAMRRVTAAAMETFGRLDGALISVGGPPRGTALAASDEQWRASFESVFLGTVRAARVVASILRPGGAIGLVLSTSVRSPVGNLGISNGLRPGLAGAAKDMADELGPRGIRVVGLLPGRILTDRMRELFTGAADPVTARAGTEREIPLGRLGEPAEFGRVAAFVLSPAAAYLTGTTITVDGGLTRAL